MCDYSSAFKNSIIVYTVKYHVLYAIDSVCVTITDKHKNQAHSHQLGKSLTQSEIERNEKTVSIKSHRFFS